MSTIITWGLVAFLVLSLTLSIRRALRGGTRRRTLLIDALLGNLPLAVLVGGLTTMPWNTVLPVAVWWIIAGLLGILAGSVTYRVLHVRPAV
ncbi:hypothetical protein B842_05585 [Corynebacterium humireducens NBRC 106098 = DSM 45392]|uniref:Uncharacterized protein n=1 Tax=Corynebacterium humireducens NBRC 106098 = DSM 45392 TaxID=1223515 RepID=A0A0B5D2M2_9CORY|nr:hypothetical protein [Corynebacterium humireducens]AJE32966.1 hypothetical protein B842_05585 [Corynebacterium humireducens NBRC 106098 = DSM 45392]